MNLRGPESTFFAELKRRNVFRVAAVYLATAWLIVHVGTVLGETIETPDWVMRFVILLLVLGFPSALGFAWAFEVTPQGLKRTREVPRQESITRITGRKLDFAIIGALAAGLSTGGMTLLHMATQQPERVEAMILIGATTYFPEPAREVMRGVSTPDSLPPDVSELLRQCVTRGDSQIRELVSEFHEFKDSYDDMNFTPPHLQTIAARTLIVHGDRDALFPVDIPMEMYGSIPNSYLWIVPNGPHVVPMFGGMADQFLSVAVGFLSGD